MLQNTKVFHLAIILLVFIIGTWLFIPAFVQGIGTAYDSVSYLSAAENFAQGKGLLSYDGRPYSNWPPLYPLLLVPIYVIDSGRVLQVGLMMNIIAAIGTHILFYLILKELLSKKLFILYGVIIGVGSMFSFLIFSNLISETFYVPFTLFFILIFFKYLQESTNKNFYYLVAAAWLCVMQRYVGIVTVVLGCTCITILLSGSFAYKIRKAFLFSILSLLPLMAWVFRNMLVTKTLSGADRTTAVKFVKYNLVNAIEQVWSWFLPYYNKPGFVYIAALILIGVLVLALFYLWKMRANLTSQRLMFLLLFGHTVVYIVFVTITAIIQSSSPIEPRLSAPAYFTAIPLFCFMLSKSTISSGNKIIKYILIVVGTITLVYTYQGSYTRWKKALIEGEGLNNDRWRKSELLEYLKTSEGNTLLNDPNLYCNFPEALYLYNFGYVKNVMQEHKKGVLHSAFKENKSAKKVLWFDSEETFQDFMKANNYPSTFKVLKSFEDGVIMEEVK